MNRPIRILLVDDQAIVRAGLRMLVENHQGFKVVSEADTLSEAVPVVAREQPDIVLCNLSIGGENGLNYLPNLLASSRARVIILTGVADPDVHKRAIRLGAMGLILKDQQPEVLYKAIEKVHAGEVWIDRVTFANVLMDISQQGQQEDVFSDAAKIKTLTKRERDVISLVARGLKNRQIASQLGVSEITVRHHLTSIFSKLEVADRFELLIYAYKHSLCELPNITGPDPRTPG